MLCTSAAVNSVLAAGTDPFEPEPNPGMLGRVRPPVDGVGVGLPVDPPQPAIARMPPIDMPVTRSHLMGIGYPVVVRQRSLRAESPQMI